MPTAGKMCSSNSWGYPEWCTGAGLLGILGCFPFTCLCGAVIHLLHAQADVPGNPAAQPVPSSPSIPGTSVLKAWCVSPEDKQQAALLRPTE